MRDGIEIIPYAEEWRDDLLLLETGLWTTDVEINARHLDWKYRDNPYLPGSDLFLAVDGRHVVGATGLYGSRWEAGSPREVVTAYCRADTLVDPAYRGKGVVGRIIEAMQTTLADRGFTYVFGTSPSVEVTAASVNRGWRASDPLEIVVRPPMAPRGWRSRARGRRRRQPDDAVFSVFDRRHRDPTRGVIGEEAARAEAMAGLVSRLPWDGRIRHVRDQAFFSWRFDNPLSVFRFLYAGDGDLDGYLVLQTHRVAERRTGVTIVDWEAVDDGVAAVLLGAAVAGAGRFPMATALSGLRAVRRALLRSHGFAESAQGIHAVARHVIVRRLGDTVAPDGWRLGDRRLLEGSDWDWREIYSDNY